MTDWSKWWAGMAMRQRIGMATGAFAVLAFAAAAGWFLLRPDYQVLFSGLEPQDAATMVAELEKLKVPYRLGEGESTILVPADQVHRTRVKLMGKELPLRGAVGFELFNNSDFGMTEFAQKVNYQRALQGELTRTIMAVEGVQSARVHLAIPEQGLFRRTTSKPKASIAIAMKPGRSLRPEQVAGIQRLVAASIPDIAPQDVTIVGQTGTALTRDAGGAEGFVGGGDAQLDAKRSAEQYLARKAGEVLEQAFGAGQAMVSVDVTLNHDQSRVTIEDVLPAKAEGDRPTGVVVRQRQAMRETPGASPGEAPHREPGQVDTEYQVGRRTEQIVTAPGAVQRVGVAVVVRAPLDKAQLDRVKELVAVAVGVDARRGDSIAVYSMEHLAGAHAVPVTATAPVPTTPAAAPKPAAPAVDLAYLYPWWREIAAAVGMALLLLVLAMRRSKPAAASPGAKSLTTAEREALLANVRKWLDNKAAGTSAPGARR
ncbi:MAG TPA: flagellar basal-body MS-ring/collar protein FliF [Usitatibacter sp.]|nr:flagellar basal-body MS-ring/collar protein FliF [Usitatibacter sp.]